MKVSARRRKGYAHSLTAGHHTLTGRIYGKGFGHLQGIGARIYHGIWGCAPFQSLYERGPGTWASLPTMPEWQLIIWFLAGCSLLGLTWHPLLVALPLLAAAIALSLTHVVRASMRARGVGMVYGMDTHAFVTGARGLASLSAQS